MKILGLIAGTSFQEEHSLDSLVEKRIENEFGTAQVLCQKGLVYISRHGKGYPGQIPPHMINHKANLKAMKDLGVEEIISVNSTGSLKIELEPGTLIVPDDFISLSETPTIFDDEQRHIIPTLSGKIRQKLIAASEKLGISLITKGTYYQTRGPRLETKAEIRMMSRYADIVGMTMASEAVIACEMDLEYASICSVDNFGHGLTDNPLTTQEIKENARKNSGIILTIIDYCLKNEPS
jgi:5'-methylthioadenosine phosphorylase